MITSKINVYAVFFIFIVIGGQVFHSDYRICNYLYLLYLFKCRIWECNTSVNFPYINKWIFKLDYYITFYIHICGILIEVIVLKYLIFFHYLIRIIKKYALHSWFKLPLKSLGVIKHCGWKISYITLTTKPKYCFQYFQYVKKSFFVIFYIIRQLFIVWYKLTPIGYNTVQYRQIFIFK